jgi:hypothetical protein
MPKTGVTGLPSHDLLICFLENVDFSASHNPMGLHGLVVLYFIITELVLFSMGVKHGL